MDDTDPEGAKALPMTFGGSVPVNGQVIVVPDQSDACPTVRRVHDRATRARPRNAYTAESLDPHRRRRIVVHA